MSTLVGHCWLFCVICDEALPTTHMIVMRWNERGAEAVLSRAGCSEGTYAAPEQAEPAFQYLIPKEHQWARNCRQFSSPTRTPTATHIRMPVAGFRRSLIGQLLFSHQWWKGAQSYSWVATVVSKISAKWGFKLPPGQLPPPNHFLQISIITKGTTMKKHKRVRHGCTMYRKRAVLET